MAILVSRGLTKRFGGLVAISQLDLDVGEKAIHSIIGPNGAGKTTFLLRDWLLPLRGGQPRV